MYNSRGGPQKIFIKSYRNSIIFTFFLNGLGLLLFTSALDIYEIVLHILILLLFAKIEVIHQNLRKFLMAEQNTTFMNV